MKRIALLSAAAVAAVVAALAAFPRFDLAGRGEQPRPAPPRIELPTPEIDLGEIRFDGDGDVSRKARIVNRGGSPLKIEGLIATCACTRAKATRDRIPPGESADVELTVSARRKTMRNSAVVQIRSDDPIEPTTAIRLHWRYLPETASASDDLVLKRTNEGAGTGSAWVFRHPDSNRSANDFSVRSSNSRIAVRIAPAVAPTPTPPADLPRFIAAFEVRASVPRGVRVQKGDHITLVGSDRAETRYELKEVDSVDLKATPAVLVADASSGPTRSYEVRLRSIAGIAFRITGVQTAGKVAARAAAIPVEPKAEHELRLFLTPPTERGAFKGEIRFDTDRKEEPHVLVEVVGYNSR